MSYLKSFLISILLSVTLFGIFDLITAMSIFDTWESLSSPPSKPVKLLAVIPDFYYAIIVESENGNLYHSYGDKRWFDKDDPEIVITNDDIQNSSITLCNRLQLKFIGLYIRNKKILECYEYYVQYPEAGAELTIVLDQNGEVWQDHELSAPDSFKIPRFMLVLALAFILEIFWLVFPSIKGILSRLR